MNGFVEFLTNKDNRTAVVVTIVTVLLSLVSFYYWQMLTGRILVPQSLEQFPLEYNEGSLRINSEIEDQAKYLNGVPTVGDEFNLDFYVDTNDVEYTLKGFDLMVSYPFGDLEFESLFSQFNRQNINTVVVDHQNEETLIGKENGGRSQVMTLRVSKDNLNEISVDNRIKLFTLRFKRLTAGATSVDWYGNESSVTVVGGLGSSLALMSGSHVLDAVDSVGDTTEIKLSNIRIENSYVNQEVVMMVDMETNDPSKVKIDWRLLVPGSDEPLDSAKPIYLIEKNQNNGCLPAFDSGKSMLCPGRSGANTVLLTGYDSHSYKVQACVTVNRTKISCEDMEIKLLPNVDESGCDKSIGDANCDGRVNVQDFNRWFIEMRNGLVRDADFNGDGRVNALDYNRWFLNVRKQLERNANVQ